MLVLFPLIGRIERLPLPSSIAPAIMSGATGGARLSGAGAPMAKP
jgi:hypothetical protein